MQRLWMAVLRRRWQRYRLTWGKLERMTELAWPPVRIRHPWPDRRFAVKHSRQEPYALARMYGVCAGGAWQPVPLAQLWYSTVVPRIRTRLVGSEIPR